MTSCTYSRNLQTFLNYDFDNRRKYLRVENGKLVVEDHRDVCIPWFSEWLIERSRSWHLSSVVAVIAQELKNVNDVEDIVLARQCALLERQIRVHNNQTLFPIHFHNPTSKVMHVAIKYLVIPKQLQDEKDFATKKIEIVFTPLTTFSEVCFRIGEVLLKMGCWKIEDATPVEELKQLSLDRVNVWKWRKENPDKNFTIIFPDFDLSKHEDHLERDNFNRGKLEGVFRARPLGRSGRVYYETEIGKIPKRFCEKPIG
ncbi:MAG: hypothetical protein KDK72_03555 [Chlamydiia bacterium]|nr:hypothetical protein [Chlamydiia bacterium]